MTGPAVGNGSHSFNRATSRLVSSTATSDLYRNADGSFTRIVSAAPVNYRRQGGSWSRINTSLGLGTDGRWHEKANGQSVDFAGSAADAALASVGFDASHGVSWSLAGARSVAPTKSGSQVTYAGVLAGTDLRLSAVASGLKESLVLHSAAAGSSWVFPLTLDGLKPRIAASGSVEFVGASGQVVARVPAGIAEDSSVGRGSGAHARTAVKYQLVMVHGALALRMSVDAGWLADSARVFPVVVDPSFTASGTTYVEKNDSGDFSSYYNMNVGTWDSGYYVDNSLLAFSGLGSALAGERITSASLSVFDYYAGTCTAEPFSVNPITSSWSVTGSKTWPGPSVGSSIGSVTANPGAACTNSGSNDTIGTWMSVPLSTSTFNSWTTGGADNGLALTASSTDNTQWKRFDSDNSPNPPYLVLNYTPDVPPQIDGQYPPNNYGAPTLTPELLASGHDPDNWPSALMYDFTVYSASGTKLADSGQVSSPDWVVPSGVLSWSTGYYWTVQDFDGYGWSALAPTNFFTTTVPQPLITSGLSQNADAHGFDPSIGNYTTSATDASVSGVGPALSVARDYNSLDPRSSEALGAGWSSMLDGKAAEVADASGSVTSVVVTYPTGQEIGFGRNSDGSFASPSGRFATLKKVTGGYTLTDKSGTVYTFAHAAGTGVYAVSSVADYEGRALSFTYAGSTVSTVTSGVSGRALHFTWSTPSGASFAHVASVATDPVTPGVPSSAQTWTYTYSGDELAGVCAPTSTTACTTYTYAAGSHYPTSVLDAGPYSYWRLGDASGSSSASSSVLANEQADAGSYASVGLGSAAGPLPGGSATAGTFNGSSSSVSLPANLVTASSNQSVSLWFKTTSAGVLFSYQGSPISGGTTSGNYTPALYVGSDGKLHGEFWYAGGPSPVVSAGSVADGAWHQVVLSAGGSAQSMYLDGALVGSLSGQVQLISQGSSFEYVGAGFWGGHWADEPHYSTSSNTGYADYFSGSISDVAFYTHALSASVVGQQYAAGHTAAGVLASVTRPSGKVAAQVGYDPMHDRVSQVTDENGGVFRLGGPSVTGSSQVYASSVLGSGPEDYWRLADAGGTQPADQVHGGAATYSSVTLGAAGAFGAGDVTAASLNGTSSDVQLPGGLLPAGSAMSAEVWFQTTHTGGVLVSAQSVALGQSCPACTPALWVGTDGRLRALAPGATATGENFNGALSRCMDDNQGGTANGTKIQVYTCNGSVPQSWTVGSDGTIRDYGKCLDISGDVNANGTKVQLWGCNGGAGQVWQPYNSGWRNPGTGRCLDDPSGSTTNGTQLQIWDCNGSAAQDWNLGLSSASAVTDGKWHHAVLTTSGATTSLFLDGALAQSSTAGSTIALASAPFAYLGAGSTGSGWAGALPANGSGWFNGSLEESAFYRSTLSPSDVARHYAAYKGSLGSAAPVSTVQVTDPGSKTLTYAFDPNMGNRGLSVTDATGAKTSYGYDVGGFLYTVTDPDGNVTTTGHDVRGNTVSSTTCQSLAANACSTQYFTYFPDDTTVNPAPDPRNDLPLTSRDARSASASDNTYLTSYTYNGAGNRTGVTSPPVAGYPSGRTASSVYTDGTATFPAADSGNAPAGLIASSTSPGGAVTRIVYLHDGDIASVTDPAGEVTRYSYDGLGRASAKTVVSTSYPNGLVTSYGYDGQDRVVTKTDPGVTDRVTGAVHTAVTTSVYDTDGNPTSVTVADATGGDASRTTSSTYDAAGRVASSTDAAGNTTTFGYDTYGNKTRQTDAAGGETDYAYDADGHLLTTTLVGYTGDPAHPQSPTNLVEDSRAYDPAGRLASVTDSMGWVTSYTYTDNGLTATVTRSDPSRGLSFLAQSNTYDTAGNLTQQVTNNGTTTTTHSIDAAGRTTATTSDPLGAAQTTSFVFGPDDTVSTTTVSDATGASAVTDATYDPLGRMTSRTVHDDGTAHTRATTTWTLDSRGLPTAMTDPNGNVTAYAYDEAGKQAVTTAPTVNTETGGGTPMLAHPVTTTGYNTFGEPVESCDPDGNITTTVVDADGRGISATVPGYTPPGSSTAITAVTTQAYDKLGQVASATDPLNNTTSYTYDQLGDVATTTAPDNAITHNTYDTNGDTLTSTDPTGAQTQATYDYLGRQVSATQIVRQPTQSAYTTTSAYTDTAGYLSSITSPDAVNASYTYDALGRKTTATDSTGNVSRYQYSQYGVTKITAPDGTARTASYDQAGQAIAVADLDASGTVLRTTSQAFDADGNPVSATDALGHTSTLTYDATNLLTAETQPVTSTNSIATSFGYDAAGNHTRFTDGRGNAFLTTYNTWNLPESTIEPSTTAHPNTADRTFTTAYDADGRPATQTSPGNVVVTTTYDALGRVTGQTGTGAEAATVAHTYGYDAAGHLTSAAAPGGTDAFTYDDRGLLLSTAGPSGTSAFGYNGDGLMTSRTDAAGTSSYGYDTAGRLSTVTDAATAAHLTYGYNNDSQPTSIGYGTGSATRTFSYDNLHRLTGDTLKTPGGATEASIAYGYDLNGNETSKTTTGFTDSAANTYTYDQASRLTSWNNGTTAVAYGYDASGNRTQVGANTFTYDARNELTSDGTNTYTYTARGTLAATGTTATTSDAFNRVITQGTQTYTYDGLDRVLTAGTQTFTYTGTGNTLASDGTATYSRGPGDGLIGIKQGGTATLALTDQHTDLVAQFTPAGTTLTGSATYDPLGNPTAATGMLGHLGYQSGWTDTTTGKVNMASRWYNPATGQFNSRDTIALNPAPTSISANRYAYADDNPLTGTDPTGHCAIFDWGCYAGAAGQNIASAWNAGWNTLGQDIWHAGAAYNQGTTLLGQVSTAAGQQIGAGWHTVTTNAHHIYDAHVAPYVNPAVNYIRHQVSHWCAGSVTASSVCKTTAYAATAAYHYAQHHAADISAMAAGTLAYAGCLGVAGLAGATTAGVGFGVALTCGTVAGFAAGAVGAWVGKWQQCSTGTTGDCSTGAYASSILIGGGIGGAAGFIGAGIGGWLSDAFGGMISDALPAVLKNIIAKGAGGALSGAAAGGAAGGLTYRTSCGSHCNWGDALNATGGGALTGGVIGGLGGAIDGAFTKNTPKTGNTDTTPTSPDDNTGPGGCGAFHSFIGATPVLLANGTTKPIDKIKTGDLVANAQPGERKTETHRVDAVITTTTDHDFIDITINTKTGPQTIHTTTHHLFYDTTTTTWTQASKLQPRHHLQSTNGTTATITAVRQYTHTTTTYDLTINHTHTYYIEAGTTPILVHNDNCTGNTTPGRAVIRVVTQWPGGPVRHATISVIGDSFDGYIESELVRRSDGMALIRAAGLGDDDLRPLRPGEVEMSITIPDAAAARKAQIASLGTSPGPYDLRDNSCVTYCVDILRAGGVEIPAGRRGAAVLLSTARKNGLL